MTPRAFVRTWMPLLALGLLLIGTVPVSGFAAARPSAGVASATGTESPAPSGLATDPTTLSSANPTAAGCFGCSVAVSGDTVVVGAPDETSGGYPYQGNAYLFNYVDGSWTLTATLVTQNPKADGGGEFGTSVAIGDGVVFVAAPDEPSGGDAGAGNVYAFNAATGAWITTLVSPNNQEGGDFGYSLAASGDSLIVGAPGETAGGHSDAGNAYVCTYDTEDNTCDWTATLSSSNTRLGGHFGWSVGIDGTIAVVGAPFEEGTIYPEVGNVYAFNYETGTWTPTTLTNPDPQYSGRYGTSVAVSGDSAAVGTYTGQAYVFSYATGAWTQTQSLTSPCGCGVEFGISVALSGTTLIVGAPLETSNEVADAGNAYVFDASTGDVTQTLTSSNSQEFGDFGEAVAVSGSTFVVGAPGENSEGTGEAGNAYVFQPPPVTIQTSLSATTIPVGGEVTDSATLSGVTASAGGTVSYNVYDGGSCAGAPVSTQMVDVSDGSVPDSLPTVFAVGGSYSFQAVYSGDPDNAEATSACEPLTVEAVLSVTDSVGISDTPMILPPSLLGDSLPLGDSVLSACASSEGQESCAIPVVGGSVSSDQTSMTGVSVDVSGTSGSYATITTQDLGASQPGGTGVISLSGAAFYDVRISGVSGGTATVCITPSGGATTMEYYDSSTLSWATATPLTFPDSSICGEIPVDLLTGTYIATGTPASTTSTTTTSSSSTTTSSPPEGVPQFPVSVVVVIATGLMVIALLRMKAGRPAVRFLRKMASSLRQEA